MLDRREGKILENSNFYISTPSLGVLSPLLPPSLLGNILEVRWPSPSTTFPPNPQVTFLCQLGLYTPLSPFLRQSPALPVCWRVLAPVAWRAAGSGGGGFFFPVGNPG